MKQTYTDIHTHILPAVDDGARDVETALELFRLQKECGVERVVLTPHFYPQEERLDAFLRRRQQAYNALLSGYNEEIMPQLLLGAEVRYSPMLVELELEQLTFGNGSYLLLELPDTEIPTCVEQVVEKMRRKGIIPILAHVERCVYFRHEPELLLRLVRAGVLGQISSGALQNKKDHSFGESCIKNGLAHIVASDVHDQTGKPSCLGKLAEGEYRELIAWTESFAKAVWDDTPLPSFAVHPMKRSIWGYR